MTLSLGMLLGGKRISVADSMEAETIAMDLGIAAMKSSGKPENAHKICPHKFSKISKRLDKWLRSTGIGLKTSIHK